MNQFIKPAYRSWSIDCDLVTPKKCHELFPMLNVEDVLGGLWIPGDGVGDPHLLCMSLMREATDKGEKTFFFIIFMELNMNSYLNIEIYVRTLEKFNFRCGCDGRLFCDSCAIERRQSVWSGNYKWCNRV